jgi:hypothetical protein
MTFNAKETTGMADSNTPATSHKTLKRMLLGLLIAVVAAGVAVLLVWSRTILSTSVQGLEVPPKVSVHVSVSGDGFDPSNSSPVPLHVSGTDIAQNEVSEDVFSGDDGSADVDLAPGDYQVEVAAPCLTSDGYVFKGSDSEAATVSVTMDGADAEPPMTVAAVDAIDVTDDDIQQAKDYAEKAGVDSGTVDEWASKAEQNRQDAIDAKAAAEESARQEAEKQQALDANPSVIHSTMDSQDSETVTLTGTVCKETVQIDSVLYPDHQADV